jgi:hypothetical protein
VRLKESALMPLQPKKQESSSNPPVNCWLVRRQTDDGSEEYVARFKATALMIWDHMQHEVLLHGPTPTRMALVWRPTSGEEQTLATMNIETRMESV